MTSSSSTETLSRVRKRRASKDADDLEAAALRAGASVSIPLDEGVYDQEISEEETEGEAAPQARDPLEEATERDAVTEQLVTAAVSVVHERQRLLGPVYPFHVSTAGLEYIGSRTFVYELCLALVTVNVSVNPYKPLQTAFERLAGAAMAIILGPEAEFLRTGYPPDSAGAGEPQSFADAVAMLNERMPGEWVVDPSSRLADAKDGGMDAVVWRRLDGRTGTPIYVANCGCGRNWLKENKHRERPSETMALLLSRPKEYHVANYFCVPFHINEDKDWEDARTHGRLVFDRLRLTLAAEQASIQWAARGQTAEVLRGLIQVADSEFKPQSRELN